MSCQKRKAEKEERHITAPSPSKRGCFHKESPSPSQKVLISAVEKSSQGYSDEERKRVVSILEAEFNKELQAKEDEIIEIQERILKTQRILQYLCYAVVSDFYSKEKTITAVASTRQRRIHPAVKKLLSGKGPPGAPEQPRNVTIPADKSSTSSNIALSRNHSSLDDDILARVDSPRSSDGNSEKERKVPRYIPPKPKTKANAVSQSQPVRGGQNKVKTILVVGNVSKWFPPDSREDAASHKWMVYVRGPKDAPDISSFVSKVRFFLHPSYRPNDIVQVVCPPFQLSRRGWGEFPIRVQVHFSNSLNKPVDIIHNLKLDRTYSGLQTLGAETVAEVWLHREKLHAENSPCDGFLKIKEEPVETSDAYSSQQTEESNQTIINASQILGTSSSNVLDASSQKVGQDTMEKTEFLPAKLPETSSAQQINRPLVSAKMKADMSSSVSLHQTVHDSSATISIPSKIKTEHVSEDEQPAMPVITALNLAASTASDIVGKLATASNDLAFSPSKTIPAETILKPSVSVQQIQLSPAKLGAVSVDGSIQVSQKVQVSPSKPGTQLVKCVDSKGNVRVLQVRTDLLPKLLKGGTTITQASTSPTKGSPVKMVVSAPSSCTSSTAQPQTVVSSGAAKLSLTSPPLTLGLQAGTAMPPRGLAPGARQVLRLVKPVGDTTVRPMLVAANSLVQPRVGIPMQATGNGNRPLLVLKDGKLFMMKSAIPRSGVTAAVSAGKPELVSSSALVASSSTPNSAMESKPNVIVKSYESPQSASSAVSKTTVARSIDPSVTTHSTKPTTQLVTTSNFSTTSSKLCKALDVNVKENMSCTVMNHQQILPLNSGNVRELPSSISIPPVLRLPPPKAIIGNNQVVQSVNKSNLLLTQCSMMPPGTLGLSSTPKITVKPGKSLLKSSVSLLKSNVGASSAVNKVATVPTATTNSSLVMLPPPLVPSLTSSAVIGATVTTTSGVKRIILGRTSGPSTITATSQRSLAYRELLGSVVRSCPKDLEDVLRALRWMIKNLPLINSEAKHPEFRILHPYCAPDEKTFCSWNIGKQRACEWLRAKNARLLLKEAGWNLQKVWSTREIVLWARFHGFTPGLPEEETFQSRIMPCDGDCEDPIKAISDYGQVASVDEWLATQEVSLIDSSSLICGPKLSCPADESDEEVDIVSTFISPSKVKIKQEPCSSTLKHTCEEIPLDSSLHSIGDMVMNTLKRCGLRLSSEEIVPGVLYPAAQRVLIQAVQSLAEDLARRALADAWGQNVSRRPGSIETFNVCGAICHRPELDIFTCAGLGIAPPGSSCVSSKNSSSKKSLSKPSKSNSSSKNKKRT